MDEKLVTLKDLEKLINPEQGCIEFWYCETGHPVPNQFGYYRMLDGTYGLGGCVGFFASPDNIEFVLNCGGERVAVDCQIQSVPDNQWVASRRRVEPEGD